MTGGLFGHPSKTMVDWAPTFYIIFTNISRAWNLLAAEGCVLVVVSFSILGIYCSWGLWQL